MDWSLCPAENRNPEKLGGAWCFKRTCQAVKSLFEYIDSGPTVDEFLEAFPGVEPALVHEVLQFPVGPQRSVKSTQPF